MITRLFRCAAAALMLAMAAHNSFAQAPQTVQLQNLTWTELRDQIQAGKTTVIIPIGGTEQSGPYIAVGKHNVRAEYLADRIAQKLGNALVAPVVAYVPEGGYAPTTSHMRFPGTITVPDDVFEKLLESAANSFAVASPMPRFPPVIIAALFASLMSIEPFFPERRHPYA